MHHEARSQKLGSDQFDALIELLATDDTGDDSNFHIVPEGTASTGLRDDSGKLDFQKIRSLFLQRRLIISTTPRLPTPFITSPTPGQSFLELWSKNQRHQRKVHFPRSPSQNKRILIYAELRRTQG
ncbi:hypothetical protein B0F90DRAFT_828694 [Multifurca ochricompacta]|uniref:Uncharacterized protein n=1 Tax=Multifurca ochricompacta TaxID=376703 RepID=A0AAD4QM58_9AGAM|nr:hypothetical protein B0F90DRAFT_828694 [Multifurca ochricompacta]